MPTCNYYDYTLQPLEAIAIDELPSLEINIIVPSFQFTSPAVADQFEKTVEKLRLT